MRPRLRVTDQVNEYVARLNPEPRQILRQALKGLPAGDTIALGGPLEGLRRLRVGMHRVIYATHTEGDLQVVECVFAQLRPVVYKLLGQLVASGAIRIESAD